MVLAAEDELAYGRVLGVISECGEALIMDGYLAQGSWSTYSKTATRHASR
jgi:hypothetical protein